MLRECYYQDSYNTKLIFKYCIKKHNAEELPSDYMFEIRCIDDFAMAYYKLRDGEMMRRIE